MKILVLGYIVRGPLGGMSWHHFQYVMGLKKLGHEVLFLEDSDNYEACYDPSTFSLSADPAYGLKFIDALFRKFDIGHLWCYYDYHRNRWYGKHKKEALDFCSKADVVLNISGINPEREWWLDIPVRVLIDTDPVFVQIRNLTDSSAKAFSSVHNRFFTFGENFGKHRCSIPDDGFPWKTTRQPLFTEAWNATASDNNSKWTTVMKWDSYQDLVYDHIHYGMKSKSFADYMMLPQLLRDEKFEIALGADSETAEFLRARDWQVISSLDPTKTPWTFQDYISKSKGEWSVAKEGYVKSNSGWFSERSLSYLASGKPVVVQETGFSENISGENGLLTFVSLEDIVEAIIKVNMDYKAHSKGARELAIEFFDSDKVLEKLLRESF